MLVLKLCWQIFYAVGLSLVDHFCLSFNLHRKKIVLYKIKDIACNKNSKLFEKLPISLIFFKIASLFNEIFYFRFNLI